MTSGEKMVTIKVEIPQRVYEQLVRRSVAKLTSSAVEGGRIITVAIEESGE